MEGTPPMEEQDGIPPMKINDQISFFLHLKKQIKNFTKIVSLKTN